MIGQAQLGRYRRHVGWIVMLTLVGAAGPFASLAADPVPEPDLPLFFQAAALDDKEAEAALEQVAASWRNGYSAMLVDLARLMRPRAARGEAAADPGSTRSRTSGGRVDRDGGTLMSGAAGASSRTPARDPGSPVRRRLIRFLERQTGKRFGDDLDGWRRWIWSLEYEPHGRYAFFKGAVYGNIDPRMREFFPAGVRATIRLDQVDWGGVQVNGIPPLVDPAFVTANDAGYLKDKHVVFGVAAGGEARAYPRRILGWHELLVDTLGGVRLTLVYCTLCGSAVAYDSAIGERVFTFGTSGLLYRSNKLMFDEETMSLWSSLAGRPVVGPLAGSDLELRRLPIVTTTWGEWRRMHPDTVVLSLDTGFERDYSEGAAYRDYFRSDRLMFAVPETDRRLRNKAEVLAIPAPSAGAPPLAISTRFLERSPVYVVEHAGRTLVVLTSEGGASRVYRAGDVSFGRWDGGRTVRDTAGGRWQVGETALVSENTGQRLPRVAAHRAFWFGWYAQHPDTDLIR